MRETLKSVVREWFAAHPEEANIASVDLAKQLAAGLAADIKHQLSDQFITDWTAIIDEVKAEDNIEEWTQYALVREDGEYATMTHQDDEETPLISATLPGLLQLATEWADFCEIKHFMKTLEPGGDFAGYKIVKEEVRRVPLTADELALIEKAKTAGYSLDEQSEEDDEDEE